MEIVVLKQVQKELRAAPKDVLHDSEYRVFYFIRAEDAIYIIHASNKKAQTISKMTATLLKARLGRIGHE